MPVEGRRLQVTFVNGVQKIYDCQWLLTLDRFQLLKSDTLFNAVRVDLGGYGVSWNDEMDLSEYELWNNGVAIDPGSAALRNDEEIVVATTA